MRELKTIDYLIGALEIIGTLEILGLLGNYLLVLWPFFLFLSMSVVLFSLTALLCNWLAGMSTPTKRRVYLFYILTNFLPVLANWIR